MHLGTIDGNHTQIEVWMFAVNTTTPHIFQNTSKYLIKTVSLHFIKSVMCRICCLRLLLAADNNFYLWLTVEKIHAFAVFNDKYLRPYRCSDRNFTATVNFTNPKTQIVSKIIEKQTNRIPIDFLFLS